MWPSPGSSEPLRQCETEDNNLKSRPQAGFGRPPKPRCFRLSAVNLPTMNRSTIHFDSASGAHRHQESDGRARRPALANPVARSPRRQCLDAGLPQSTPAYQRLVPSTAASQQKFRIRSRRFHGSWQDRDGEEPSLEEKSDKRWLALPALAKECVACTPRPIPSLSAPSPIRP